MFSIFLIIICRIITLIGGANEVPRGPWPPLTFKIFHQNFLLFLVINLKITQKCIHWSLRKFPDSATYYIEILVISRQTNDAYLSFISYIFLKKILDFNFLYISLIPISWEWPLT